jgi:hypothetical protein
MICPIQKGSGEAREEAALADSIRVGFSARRVTATAILKSVCACIMADKLCINTIRVLAADMVQKAESGHPGPCARAVVRWIGPASL